jgi:hypothetical protein
MATYFEDKEFSERMMPLVETVLHGIDKRRLFGSLLNDSYKIKYADEEQDRKHATDLVLQPRNLNISVRVRRSTAATFWPQMTLSEGKERHLVTQEDYVDAYFVGIASFDETRLSHWFILNLHRFRECLRDTPSIFSIKNFRNKRGERFLGYTIPNQGSGLIIQSSHPLGISEISNGVNRTEP